MKNEDKSHNKPGSDPPGDQSAERIEVRSQAVFESSRDAIGVSKAGVHVFVNSAYRELFGFSPDADLAGIPVLDLIAPEHREELNQYILRRMRGESAKSTCETRGLRLDGSAFDMEVNVSSFWERGEIQTLAVLRDITERKLAEEEISERGAMLRQIMDTASVAIGLVDKSGRITHANRRMAEMFGWTLKELIGCEYGALVHPSERETGRKNMQALLASKIPSVDLERLYWRKDGTEFWGHLACRRFHDIHGNGLGLIGVITDITDRKRAEDNLRENEDKFRSIFENAIDGIMIADAETNRQIEANRTICIMLGYSRDEIVRLHMKDIHPKEDLPRIKNVFEQQLRGEISMAPNVPMLRKDGSVVYVDINATRVTLGGKQCLIGIFRDISERKKAEAEIRETENRYRLLFETANDGIFILDATGFRDCNQRGAEMYGLSKEKLIGRSPVEFAPERQPDRRLSSEVTGEKIQAALSGVPQLFEWQSMRSDGTLFDVEITLSRLELGGEVCLQAIVRDITERKEAEEKIHLSEKFIRSILDTVDEGFVVIDREYRILTANKAYCRQVGGCDATILGQHCYAITHKISRPCFEEGAECAVQQVFTTREPHIVVHKHVDHGGHILFVESKAYPIKDESGNVISAIETINNITEKHLLEEERLKTQKLESIGALAGGIAHDFNNLLQGIFGYISMAKMTLGQKEKSLAMLEQAEKALHQSVNLTTQLLTFSKGGKPIKKLINLRLVIENSANFILSGSRSDLRLILPENLWTVEADEGQITQVIQNIVLNADQAMPIGGTVTIRAANLAESVSSLPPGLARENHVVIEIHDTGIGIPEQYLNKIFDPYFTTKEKGSGLGLATTYSIVRNHGGIIDVRTKPGEGTTFAIYLPAIAKEDRPASAASSSGEPSPQRAARVLVMDDEDLIRNLSSELFCALGHIVEVAERGEEALEKYQRAMAAGKPFDIVILDLTVRGGMGGSETIQQLLKIDPSVKAVVSSGYSDDAAIANHLSQGFKACLKKPYGVDDLRKVLTMMLDRE